jgi:hypothetical protein
LWDAADADRGIARVNRATRARAIGTYFMLLVNGAKVYPIAFSFNLLSSFYDQIGRTRPVRGHAAMITQNG